MNSQLILNYWARAWYLFESLAESTSMYSEDYSEHLSNYGELLGCFCENSSKKAILVLEILILCCLVVVE
ncbi:hypothetical protein T01_15987 [Trichinella spiralis]|uniref:Uncharacterized protein n=1 Tax=Trichinella spiralis TaxID=6334 RepID=A0A0V1B3I2_TRISP|nr:hypothetical protein T01_15987 [Trichinella spiralis]